MWLSCKSCFFVRKQALFIIFTDNLSIASLVKCAKHIPVTCIFGKILEDGKTKS